MGIWTPHGVFVDADVWFSRNRRDWLGMLYTEGQQPLFQVYWTEDVLAEVLASLRDQHPDWRGQRITGIRDRLAQTFEVGRIEDFAVDGSYGGGDPGDAHVHGAAVACGAQYLLTCNTKDFRSDDSELPYDVLHPDDFFVLVDESAPRLVADVTAKMTRYWLERMGSADIPRMLRIAECPAFAERVRLHLQRFA